MLFRGELVGIQISPGRQQPVRQIERVEVVAGRGLDGDHHAAGDNASTPLSASHQVTLIEQEALDAVLREYDLAVTHAQTRRNLLTKDVPLNHLVGREFTIGEVRLRGLMLCEPCGYLEKMTVPGIKKALVHRGGLRAEVVAGGVLEIGQPIRAETAPA